MLPLADSDRTISQPVTVVSLGQVYIKAHAWSQGVESAPLQSHSLRWEGGWSPKENLDSISRNLDHGPLRGRSKVAQPWARTGFHWITIPMSLKWKQRGKVTGRKSHSNPKESGLHTSFRQMQKPTVHNTPAGGGALHTPW